MLISNKVKYFFRRIKKHIIYLYRSKLMQWIRNSIIYNISKSFIVVLLLLWVIFHIVPNNAHVSYMPEKIRTPMTMKAGNLVAEIESNRISFCSNKMIINWKGQHTLIFDDKEYDNNYHIESNEDIASNDVFINLANMQDMKISIASNCYSENSSIFFSNISNNLSIDSNDGFQIIVYGEDIVLSLDQGKFSLVGNNQRIPIDICTFKSNVNLSNGKEPPFLLDFNGDVSMKLLNYTNGYVYNKAQITLYYITNCFFFSTGELNFYFTPNVKKYPIFNQRIDLGSRGSLTCDFIFDRDIKNMNIYGTVNRAEISGMSLFPNFTGWFRDNVYLAPLTLVATIFGGIELFKRKNNT